ncbi:MAG: hypothetical protein MRY49_01740 [Candidatus Pacebacteria bacterium]|nr:hypothetical protein [Candidatus Paceibacterota bacterium]
MFVITMSLVTALCLCYVKPAILMLFPNKLFVLGEGKRKYNNIKKIRAIITSIVISVVVGLFFI